MATDRIDEFESLRGLMVLWVVLGHIALTFPPPPGLDGNRIGAVFWQALEQNGRAVDVFIALSGFVIFHLLDRGRESYGRYLARRFLRLFPAYLACLLAALAMLPATAAALAALDPVTPRTLGRIAILQESLARFWPHLAAHLTMLHGVVPASLLPATDYAFLGQAWSISVEWQFYLVAPLLLHLVRLRPHWLGLGLLAGLGGGLFHARLGFGEGFVGAHVGYFALGCGSFLAWRSDRLAPLGRAVARHATLLIPTACLGWVAVLPGQWQGAVWLAVLLACHAMRSPGPHPGSGRLARAITVPLRTAPLRWLGRVSYSVYLSHMTALYATLWVLRDAGLAPWPMLAATLAGTLAGTGVASDLLHRWVEAPCIAAGRRLPPRWFPLAAAPPPAPHPAPGQPA